MSKPRFVSSVEERPPVERNVSGSNPLRGATSFSAGSKEPGQAAQGSVAQWQSTRLITGSAMVRSHPEPPITNSPTPQCRVAQRESRRSITTRSSVRSGPRQPVSFCSIHAPVAEPGYARVSETRVHRDVQVRPLPGAPISQSQFRAHTRSKQRGRNSADQSTRLLTGESMGSNPSARTNFSP